MAKKKFLCFRQYENKSVLAEANFCKNGQNDRFYDFRNSGVQVSFTEHCVFLKKK